MLTDTSLDDMRPNLVVIPNAQLQLRAVLHAALTSSPHLITLLLFAAAPQYAAFVEALGSAFGTTASCVPGPAGDTVYLS